MNEVKINRDVKSPDRLPDTSSFMAQLASFMATHDKEDSQKKAGLGKVKERSEQKPKANTVKKRAEKKNPLDLARTFAWLNAVKRVCAKEGEPPLTTNGLMKFEWQAKKDSLECPHFDRYENGTEIPELKTIELVDECLEPRITKNKGTPLGNSLEGNCSCKKVFQFGLEGLPVWNLIGPKPIRKVCSLLLDWWFTVCFHNVTPDEDNHLKTQSLLCKPFEEKIDALWTRFTFDLPVDFSEYDAGKEENVAFSHMEEKGLYPGIAEFLVIVAASVLSEEKKEQQSETRYLLDAAILCAPKTFEEYDCGHAVGKTLAKRKRYTSAVSIMRQGYLPKLKAYLNKNKKESNSSELLLIGEELEKIVSKFQMPEGVPFKIAALDIIESLDFVALRILRLTYEVESSDALGDFGFIRKSLAEIFIRIERIQGKDLETYSLIRTLWDTVKPIASMLSKLDNSN